MKVHNYNYYRIVDKQLPCSCELEFVCLEEFKRFADAIQAKEIFILTSEDGTAERFALLHNGAVFYHAAMQYKTLEDYQGARHGKFENAIIFYEATEAGYHNYEDYKIVKDAGISDKPVFEKLKTAGFVSGFKEYAILKESGVDLPEAEPFENAYALYNYAVKNGFENFSQLKKAFIKGFANMGIYNVAAEMGYPTYNEYKEGTKKGFRDYVSFKLANENGARDDADLNRMIALDMVVCKGCTFDQKVMLILLSKIEQGKKISVNKLTELHKKAVEEYRYPDNNEMPVWFTYALNDAALIIEFLQKNEQVKKYGSYDNDGEFFQVNFLQNRSVVIDASNVAYNSQGNAAPKAHAYNVIKMVNHLKQKGFSKIHIIADASLRHRISDTENIAALKESADYAEAPKETSADAFLIEFVKHHNCLLVSNDTFREWKIKDPWVAENIDFYRVTFLINEMEVLMPDLN